MIHIFQAYENELSKPMADLYNGMRRVCHELNGKIIDTRCTPTQISDVLLSLSLDDPTIIYEIKLKYVTDTLRRTRIEIIGPPNRQRHFDILNKCIDSAKNILSRCPNSPILAEKYIHDYLCKTVEYDLTEPHAHTIVGPLLFGKGVCEGISKAAKLFFDMIGIDSSLVIGHLTSSSENRWNHALKNTKHAWNKVKINGDWFHMDLTSDLTLSQNNDIRYDYFNLSDKEISKDHYISHSTLSKCSLNECNYYDLMGLSATSKETLLAIFQKSKNSSKITFKINSTSSWNPSMDEINALCRMFFASGVGYKIEYNSTQNVYRISSFVR